MRPGGGDLKLRIGEQHLNGHHTRFGRNVHNVQEYLTFYYDIPEGNSESIYRLNLFCFCKANETNSGSNSLQGN